MMKHILFKIWRITRWIIVIPLVSTAFSLNAPGFVLPSSPTNALSAVPEAEAIQWADSVYNALTDRQRIGQLFMIRAHSNLGEDHIKSVKDAITNYHVGGLCFFQGTPMRQAELTNTYQKLSADLPLLIAMDAEWGLEMRFKTDVIKYPRNLTLGAIEDDMLIYKTGRAIGRQLKRIGVHINFGPVVDINNNADNPVINDRSFGENKYNVVTKSYMYMIGLQDEGVMACAKHFPGHGDTRVDSHYDLPIIDHPISRLESVELFPFQMLSDNGLMSMMVAHVHMPALDSTPNLPTTLSKPVVDTLLKQKIGFQGLVITDALEMKGVTKHFASGEIEQMAFMAGNDILLMPTDLEKAYLAISNQIDSSAAARQRLEESVKKVLKAKYKLGLTESPKADLVNLNRDINLAEDIAIKEDLAASALTLVNDQDGLLPLNSHSKSKVACISIKDHHSTVFKETMSFYKHVAHIDLPMKSNRAELADFADKLKGVDEVVIALHLTSTYSKRNYGLTKDIIDFIEDTRSSQKTILVVFGNPYALRNFQDYGPIVVAYDDDPVFESMSAQAIFGARSLSGTLPISAGPLYTNLQGQKTKLSGDIAISLPESIGADSRILSEIDSLIDEMIDIKAAPGAQITAIKDETVFFHRAYGTKTYEPDDKVCAGDLYDLASITKVATTTLALMKLWEEGKIDLQERLALYLPQIEGTDVGNLILEDVLRHRSGLKAWIPFYKNTVTNIKKQVRLDSSVYVAAALAGYLPVAKDIFISSAYRDSIMVKIANSDIKPDQGYKYSDLGFILFTFMIEEISGMTLEDFVTTHFYEPMGLSRLVYNPYNKFDGAFIVPTEDDDYFRSQRLRGYVHDMGAAMLGGVSGHAGLFGNSSDLARLFLMLQNGGVYKDRTYLKSATIDRFARRDEGETRRGLGFDMQELDIGKTPNVTRFASSSTYGHTGFTGTCVWTDPECGITFVMLSNRVFPTMQNNRFSKYNYRPRAHYLIYKALNWGD